MATWKTLQATAVEHLSRGDLGKAAHALVEAIELEPTEPQLYEQLIQVTLLGGSTQTAVSAAEELTRLQPDAPHAHHLLVVSLLSQGEVERAKTVLTAAIARSPNSVELIQASAQVATIEQNPALALDLLGRAATLVPNDAVVVNDYALCLLQAKRPAEAKALLEPLFVANPKNAPLRLSLSMICLALKDLQGARAHALAAKDSDDPDTRAQAIALVNQLTR